VRGSARWALSPLDYQVHLLVPAGNHPWGVLKARCGVLLPLGSPSQPDRSSWGVHRPCRTCLVIAQRPCSVPTEDWVATPQDTPEGPSPAPGRPTLARAMWVRCLVDGQLHLLSARAVVEVATMGCTLAWCGTLLTIQELSLPRRGWGAPCLECLAAGSAS